MIQQAIKKTQQPLVLVLSMAGAIIGLSLLMLVTQLYSDMRYVQEKGGGAIGEQYLVIKKQISVKNTLGLSTTEFSEDDLELLSQQSFVKDMAPFTTGENFQVYAVISMESAKNDMSTLGFLESVPDKFIDVDTKKWSWQEGDAYVPLILPTTFLDAYNFGLAGTVGAPVISKELIGGLGIELYLSGNGQKKMYLGHIVDFSDRINSALVPESFLKFANNTYGSAGSALPNKVIISTTNTKDPAIEQFLEAQGWETNKEQLRGSVIEKLIHPILWFAGSLCIIIIVLTIIIFLLYTEVLIIKSNYEIKLLSLLGYPWRSIAYVYDVFFFKIYGVISLIAFLLFTLAKMITNDIIAANLLVTDLPFLSLPTLIVAIVFIGGFIIFNLISIKRQIKNLANPS
jgi:hypothetical protein